jgi:D-alanyl-lipoteichoic acid acyltransferase DltB (MBOAT superfamily)
MTLSRFLRDYVYIPLGGNRKGEARMLVAFMLTFVIGGFWHGAAWTFVLWGALHGTALVVLHFWRKLGRPLPRAVAIALTALFVAAAFVVFRAPTVADAMAILSSVTGFNGIDLRMTVPYWSWIARPDVPPIEVMAGTNAMLTLVLALVLAFTPRNSTQVSQSVSLSAPMPRLALGLLLAISVVYVQNPTEFIYFIF